MVALRVSLFNLMPLSSSFRLRDYNHAWGFFDLHLKVPEFLYLSPGYSHCHIQICSRILFLVDTAV